jgi:hypothetical protein
MARNFVEYHIQEGAFHTFKVASGQTIKIGQPVVISGDKSVSLAGSGEKAIGIVYSGTVGKDGLNVGYVGDEGDVVTVVMLKPLVYLEAGGTITAGNPIQVGSAGAFLHRDGTTNTGEVIATAVTGAVSGERFLAILG